MNFKLKAFKYSEHDGHKQLATWLELVRNQTHSFTYHSSPNGSLSKSQIGKAKSAGMRPNECVDRVRDILNDDYGLGASV